MSTSVLQTYGCTHTLLNYFRADTEMAEVVLKEDANFLLLMICLSRIYLSYASAFCIWTSSKLKISEDSSSEN